MFPYILSISCQFPFWIRFVTFFLASFISTAIVMEFALWYNQIDRFLLLSYILCPFGIVAFLIASCNSGNLWLIAFQAEMIVPLISIFYLRKMKKLPCHWHQTIQLLGASKSKAYRFFWWPFLKRTYFIVILLISFFSFLQ